jgi:ribosomal-protein-serine acetyltransferase
MVSILIDDELLLRNYHPDDAAALFQLINESRAHLRTWLSWVDRTTKPEHSLQFIQQSLQDINTQQSLTLGIFRNREIIGGIGMHNWDQELKRAQVGYWIARQFEGQGIITRSAERFLDFLFQKLNLNKIELHFALRNTRSAAVAQKLGAKTEGIIRAGCLVNGMHEDLVITGILRTEWNQRKQ